MDIGRAIREQRRARHMTLEDLSYDAGISVNTIGKIERGLEDPRFTIVLDLLDTMGMQIKITQKEKR